MSPVPNPEAQARENIDRLLIAAGWHVCDMSHANIHAAKGVAIREFPLDAGYGFADYLFYIDGKAAPAQLQRLHQEDFCHVLGVAPKPNARTKVAPISRKPFIWCAAPRGPIILGKQ